MTVFHQNDKNRIRKIEHLGPKPEMLSKKPLRIYPIWWFRFCKLVWTSLLQNTSSHVNLISLRKWLLWRWLKLGSIYQNSPKFWKKLKKKLKILETFEKNSDLRGSPIPPDLDQTGSNVNNVNLEQTKSYFNDSAVLYHLNHTLNQGF